LFKYAFALGIALEWLLGPVVASVPSLGYAAMRALMWMLAAWMVLELVRVLYRAVATMEG
jgi:hypothetical protein